MEFRAFCQRSETQASASNRVLGSGFGLVWAVLGPVALFFIYIVGVLPAAMVLRIMKQDLLRRRFDRAAGSYWICRERKETDKINLKSQV